MGARDLKIDESVAKQLAKEATARARAQAVIPKRDLDKVSLELRKLSVALVEAAAKHGAARRWEKHEQCVARASAALSLVMEMQNAYGHGGYIALPRRIADARKLLAKGLKFGPPVWD